MQPVENQNDQIGVAGTAVSKTVLKSGSSRHYGKKYAKLYDKYMVEYFCEDGSNRVLRYFRHDETVPGKKIVRVVITKLNPHVSPSWIRRYKSDGKKETKTENT